MLPGAMVKVVETHPLTPLSALSATPVSKPTLAAITIGMLAVALYSLLVTVGGSLTALIVIVKLWVALVSTPPLAVPPLSLIRKVTVAVPFWLDAEVNVRVPFGATDGPAENNAGLVLLVISN